MSTGKSKRAICTLCLAAAVVAASEARSEEAVSPAEAGTQLVTKMGCAGCHVIADPAFTGLRRRGPDLRRIAAKTKPAWAVEWVKAPREIRATTWMPHFFDDGDVNEVAAIVSYLWESSEAIDYPAPPAGDAARGKELFESVGCTGCHLREAEARRDGFEGEPYRLQGPNLLDVGGKVGAGWLYAWLKDPKRYAAETLMPNLRLEDQDAADLTAFLMEGEFRYFPDREVSPDDAERGRQAIEKYGCFGCHLVPGFEDAAPPAGELAGVSGYEGHPESDTAPSYGTSAGEAEAIGARLASLGGAWPDGAAAALGEGRKLVALFNCQGCHLVEERGHAIRATIDDVGLLPPDLKSEGGRVQSVWLSAFLKDPATVRLRPWLTAQMPTFGFSDAEVRALGAYFVALDGRELSALPAASPTGRSVAVGQETFSLLQCARCHPAGAEAAAALGLSASNLAPSLEVARGRLRYQWIPEWIKDPQTLQPGTKMPSFFYESEPGVFDSPFAGGLDAPMFAEPKARLMEHFASDEDLNKFLKDTDAVTGAMTDYIWSLGGN